VITLEDWALIRRLHVGERLPKAQIARQLGISRNTVAKAIASGGPPEYSRAPASTSFEPFEVRVRQLLEATPSMPATVLAERVGWSGSATWFRQNVARIRPDYAPTDPADRIVYHPGEQMQCDLWFPEPRIPIGDGTMMMLPVLVMVASFSKFITALKIHQLKAYDPESKGGVERINGYFETSFLPGRQFSSPLDFNTQLSSWLPKANARTVRALQARPIDLLVLDTAAMLTLPPLAPPAGLSFRVRLPRDYYVRVHGNDYSVHPAAIGRMVEVIADLHLVSVRLEGRLIADHPRSWGNALTITDPEHVSAAARLREAFGQPRPLPADDVVVLRDLADYDVAFGVDINLGIVDVDIEVAS
jgi:hypothetical protein